MRRGLFLILLSLCAGCRASPDHAVRSYLTLAAALGERDPDGIDYYYGPEEWIAGVRDHPPTLREIKQGAVDLIQQLEGEGRPRDFLIRQLTAIAARTDLLQGVRLSFDQEARAFFDIQVPSPPPPDEPEKIRREIDRLLTSHEALPVRYSSFDQRFTIPADRLPAVFDRAVQACRERTRLHLKLPPGETVTIEYVGDKPWNAYSTYQGRFHSLIRVNADLPLTVDRALQLACHEGYPGHHAYNSLVDSELVQHEHRMEFMVQPTFSPQAFQSEALATYAVDLAFPDAERLQFEREVLFPLAGIKPDDAVLYLSVNRLVDRLQIVEPAIAREYLNGQLEWARAASELEDQVLMVQSEATLKYLNEYRTYMLAYTVGRELVRDCFHTKLPADDWRLYERLILGHASIQDCK